VAAWLAYGVALGALRLALGRLPAARAAQWIFPATLAVAATWIALTPLVARVDLAVRRARLRWPPTLLVHGALALGTTLLLTLVRWRVLGALLGHDALAYWPTAIAHLDLDLGTYAAMLSVLRAVTTHRELVRRSRRALQLETELSRARLHFLQRQLRPHFLFNALNAIAQLARDAPTTSSNMMRHLAELLRAATAANDVPEVTVRDELASLASYLAIERQRFGEDLVVTQRVDPAAWTALLPPLLLQPVVENAVLHGLRCGGAVHVDVSVILERLRITVTNDGSAAGTTPRRGRGIGLPNSRARLAQLYGSRYVLALGSDAAGRTRVTIELPRHDVPERDPADAIVDDAAADPTGLTGEHPVAPEGRGAVAARVVWRFAALWLGAAVLWMAQDLAQQLLDGHRPTPWMVGRVESLSALVWAAATPAVLWLAQAARLRQGHWRVAVVLHVAASVLLSLGQVALVLHVSHMPRPLLMAANANQLVVNVMLYAALVAWTHAREFRDWYRERALASARLAREIERTRLQALTLDVRPPFLLWLLDRAARVVVRDPERGERIAERTADLLRRLLDASGRTRLAPDDARAIAEITEELRALAGDAAYVH
jgi:two-component system sensor histidine kinase AlgZ